MNQIAALNNLFGVYMPLNEQTKIKETEPNLSVTC